MNVPDLDLTRKVLLLFALTTVGGGCGGPDAEGLPAPEVGAGLWASGDGWRLADAPLVTIGALDGPEAIGTVGRIVDQSGVALLGSGRVAVADYQADEVRVYDASGARVATMGRAGDGPGEFRGVRGIARFRGDSMLAWDSRAGFYVGRLSVLTPEGAFARTLPLAGMPIRDVIGAFEDGTVLVEPQPSTPPDWERPTAGEFREPRLYRRVSADGELLGTFGPVPGLEAAAMGPTGRTLVLYGSDTHVAVGRRFIYAGDSRGFQIAVHDRESGRVLRHISRPYDPLPVTAEQLARRREAAGATNARVDSMMAALVPGRPQSRQDPADVPARETHPVFNRIVEDPDENLWARHIAPASDSLQAWSVFDPDGAWLGEVHIPSRMSVRAIGSGEIAVVVRDELGVEYVLLYRLIG
jgi:hypothetical protein